MLNLLIFHSNKSLKFYKIACNLCLLPKILALVRIMCCLSAVVPFLVAIKLPQSSRQASHQDMLLTMACWIIVLLPTCNSCQSPDIASTSLICMSLAYYFFSSTSTLLVFAFVSYEPRWDVAASANQPVLENARCDSIITGSWNTSLGTCE